MSPPRTSFRYATPSRPSRAPWVVVAILVLLAGTGAYLFVGKDKQWWPWPESCPSGGPLTIALGARANMPSPVLPRELEDLVRTAVDKEQPISVYRVDGDPTRAILDTFHTDIQASAPRRSAVDQHTSEVLAVLNQVRSQVPEADTLKALWLAARDTPVGGTVILFDSGLSTMGPLNFLREGMIEADPTEVVTFLRTQQEAIPDLAGRRVILMGIGDTFAPQEDLTPKMEENVVAIWEAIADAGGPACRETIRKPPLANASLDAVTTVTPIPLNVVYPPICTGPTRLSGGGDVGFRPDTDILLNEAQAKAFLQNLADEILSQPQGQVTVTGTTARWGTEEGQRALSRRRAEVVKRLLVELGVPADRIVTDGVGSYGPTYREDGGPDGPLDPANAAFNRSVLVEMAC